MKRKTILQIRQQSTVRPGSRDDSIRIILKRLLSVDESIEYLLSSITKPDKDDILGELAVWHTNHHPDHEQENYHDKD